MKNVADLETKLAKAARDYDKLCSSLYEKRTAVLKSSDGDGPPGIPDFWLGVLQVVTIEDRFQFHCFMFGNP